MIDFNDNKVSFDRYISDIINDIKNGKSDENIYSKSININNRTIVIKQKISTNYGIEFIISTNTFNSDVNKIENYYTLNSRFKEFCKTYDIYDIELKYENPISLQYKTFTLNNDVLNYFLNFIESFISFQISNKIEYVKAPISLIYPKNNQQNIDNENMKLIWDNIDYIYGYDIKYFVYLGKDTDTLSKIYETSYTTIDIIDILKDSGEIYYENFSLLTDTVYYWKIEAVCNNVTIATSNIYNFKTMSENIQPSSAKLLTPENNSVNIPIDEDLILSFNKSFDINDVLKYNIYFSEDEKTLGESFLIEIQESQFLNNIINIIIPKIKLQNDRQYFWKVVQIDSKDNKTESEIFNFYTIFNSVQILNPIQENDVLKDYDYISFSTSNNENIKKYKLFIFDNDSPYEKEPYIKIFDDSQTITEKKIMMKDIDFLEYGKTYKMKIDMFDINNNKMSSTNFKIFSTQSVNPNRIRNMKPSNLSSITNNVINLSWDEPIKKRKDETFSYEIYIKKENDEEYNILTRTTYLNYDIKYDGENNELQFNQKYNIKVIQINDKNYNSAPEIQLITVLNNRLNKPKILNPIYPNNKLIELDNIFIEWEQVNKVYQEQNIFYKIIISYSDIYNNVRQIIFETPNTILSNSEILNKMQLQKNMEYAISVQQIDKIQPKLNSDYDSIIITSVTDIPTKPEILNVNDNDSFDIDKVLIKFKESIDNDSSELVQYILQYSIYNSYNNTYSPFYSKIMNYNELIKEQDINHNSYKYKIPKELLTQNLKLRFKIVQKDINGGMNYSNERIININSYPTIPNIIYPIDNQLSVNINNLKLKWEKPLLSDQTSPILYEIYFGNNENDLSKISEIDVYENTEYIFDNEYTQNNINDETEYFWYIKITNDGNVKQTPISKFTTGFKYPTSFNIIKPLQNEILNNVNDIEVQFTKQTDVNGLSVLYDLYIKYEDNDFILIKQNIDDVYLTDNKYSVFIDKNLLLQEGFYSIYLIQKDSTNHTYTCDVVRFKIEI